MSRMIQAKARARATEVLKQFAFKGFAEAHPRPGSWQQAYCKSVKLSLMLNDANDVSHEGEIDD